MVTTRRWGIRYELKTPYRDGTTHVIFKPLGLFAGRNPVVLPAPTSTAEVETTKIRAKGETGTASFDISFGYSGDYSASPHGLVAAGVSTANVLQHPFPNDPFEPSDGFSNEHPIVVSGAAYVRIAIPSEATGAGADLDIFLFDSGGNFVAASTNGGTDELIELVLPANDTHTLWVQGWGTTGIMGVSWTGGQRWASGTLAW